MSNRKKALEVEKTLAENGFDLERLQTLYDSPMSFNDLAAHINSVTKKNIISRKSLSLFWKEVGLREHTREEIAQIKREKSIEKARMKRETFFSGPEGAKIAQRYLQGESLASVAKNTGLSEQYLTELLRFHKIHVRKQKTCDDLLADLTAAGYTIEDLKEMYLVKNFSVQEMLNFFQGFAKYATQRMTERFLRKHGLSKRPELTRLNRGLKSRSELQTSLNCLKTAGFDNLKDLAEYYQENKSLTKHSLADLLNRKSDGSFVFTVRWLERHMDPFQDRNRLIGVSRAELDFREEVKALFKEEGFEKELSFSNRSIIAPYELDAVSFECSLAMEFNGDYWHSDNFLLKNKNMTAKEFHELKKRLCREKNLELLYVWEHDWYTRKEDVLEAIRRILNEGTESIPEILSRLEPCTF